MNFHKEKAKLIKILEGESRNHMSSREGKSNLNQDQRINLISRYKNSLNERRLTTWILNYDSPNQKYHHGSISLKLQEPALIPIYVS